MVENRFSLTFDWFSALRDAICKEFETLEIELQGTRSEGTCSDRTHSDRNPGKFKITPWSHAEKGGGQIGLMHGRVFEKVGVNVSSVEGDFSSDIRGQIPGTENSPHFRACGISLVAHMHSPLVPSIHMNTRFIQTEKEWFGGGTDLNPEQENKEDTSFFHSQLKEMCAKHNREYYDRFKKECDEYFYIKHRNEPRGVGGIFYDYMYSPDFDKNFAFTKDVGRCFLETYPKLVRKHMNDIWTKEQKDIQLAKRGRYAEFNLIYDRGTKFGLLTGGNPEAIFISMPPLASWA